MNIFIGIVLLLVVIAFWRHVLYVLLGVVIFGLVGSIFGDTGRAIGAIIGFIGGIGAANDYDTPEDKPKQESNTSRRESPESDSSSQVVRCPNCIKKIRIPIPLKRPTGRCPACDSVFLVAMDSFGRIKISVEEREHGSHNERKGQSVSSTADYYALLGLSPSATPDEIKLAYRKRIREYHPDRVAGLGEKLRDMANEESKVINHAYSMLKAAGLAS